MAEIPTQIFILILLAFVQALATVAAYDEATVEILVIVEKNYSDQFKSPYQRQKHFCDLFQKVNWIFRRIDGGKINIALKGLKMIGNLEDQHFFEKHIVTVDDATFINDKCAPEFASYAHGKSWSKGYDAIFVLTELKTIDSSVVSVGLSSMFGFCKPGVNIAITIPEATTIAHEIGHMLGVYDDGHYYENKTLPNHALCSMEESYIMGRYKYYKTDKNLRFSPCSEDALRKQLRRTEFGCLWRTGANDISRCRTCSFLSQSGCTNYESIMQELGLETD